MSAARPLITVWNTDGSKRAEVALPSVMTAPLRPDVVQFVHTNMAKNSRQAYSVQMKAGHQTSATSWGTGRAVSRIPRVNGGGTQRSGQAAFGNMCRSGRMFAPTKTWRKWHRKINTSQKRYAVASSLAASAVPALVMARGHNIDQIPECPLVLSSDAERICQTSWAVKALTSVGAFDDVEKAAKSKGLRCGKGKGRNRRYVMRRGPLVIYANDDGISQGFRNLPGVELCNVDRLNLLQLAPGGHMGRFCVWTEAAFAKLDSIYGENGKSVPATQMINADLARIINSDEIQSVVNPAKANNVKFLRKKNAIKSMVALEKLSPYAAANRKAETKAQSERKGKKKVAKKASKKAFKKVGKEFIAKVSAQGNVCEDGFTGFN